MKVFKKVMILTVAILSLSSTVAFGASNCTQPNSSAVDSSKTGDSQTGSGQQQGAPSAGTAGGPVAPQQ